MFIMKCNHGCGWLLGQHCCQQFARMTSALSLYLTIQLRFHLCPSCHCTWPWSSWAGSFVSLFLSRQLMLIALMVKPVLNGDKEERCISFGGGRTLASELGLVTIAAVGSSFCWVASKCTWGLQSGTPGPFPSTQTSSAAGAKCLPSPFEGNIARLLAWICMLNSFMPTIVKTLIAWWILGHLGPYFNIWAIECHLSNSLHQLRTSSMTSP